MNTIGFPTGLVYGWSDVMDVAQFRGTIPLLRRFEIRTMMSVISLDLTADSECISVTGLSGHCSKCTGKANRSKRWYRQLPLKSCLRQAEAFVAGAKAHRGRKPNDLAQILSWLD
jgi:hypothetical protein